jgi:peptidyl-prolyl cis-trans isomerase B (cyclophilin B)
VAYPNQVGGQPVGAQAPIYVAAPATNGMAIAALILAIVFYPLGIVFGHMARGQINRTHEGGRGLATAALVIGYLQLAVTVGVIVVAAVLVALGAQ